MLANPVVRRRRHRTRRSNPVYVMRVRRRRRRNPELLGTITDTAKQVASLLAGATLTKMVGDRLPASINTGALSYVSSAAVAWVLGYGGRAVGASKEIADNLMLGGFTYVGLKLLSDLFPQVAGITPFGLRGMGVIQQSEGFPVPLVNQPGSMTKFVTPAYVAQAAANAISGLSAGRRVARVR